MGYTTYFSGRFELDKKLTVSQAETINALADYTADKPDDAPDSESAWRVSPDGKYIEPLNEEKMYWWDDWLEYIAEKHLAPAGVQMNGRVVWQGEDTGDAGVVFVKNNRVKLVSIEEMPEPDWGDDGQAAATA